MLAFFFPYTDNFIAYFLNANIRYSVKDGLDLLTERSFPFLSFPVMEISPTSPICYSSVKMTWFQQRKYLHSFLSRSPSSHISIAFLYQEEKYARHGKTICLSDVDFTSSQCHSTPRTQPRIDTPGLSFWRYHLAGLRVFEETREAKPWRPGYYICFVFLFHHKFKLRRRRWRTCNSSL